MRSRMGFGWALLAGLCACDSNTASETSEGAGGGAVQGSDASAGTTGTLPRTDATLVPGTDATSVPAHDSAVDGAVPVTDAGPPGSDGAGGMGGGGADGMHAGADAGEPCVPDRNDWDREVHGLVDTYCGQCHGETLAFGAPFGLLDYDDLLVPTGGRRPLDRIAPALSRAAMPPFGQPQPTDEESLRIAAWATCGDPPDRPVGPIGLEVSADVLLAPAAPPRDTPFFDLTADEYELRPRDTNPYVCFRFQSPENAEGLIRRIEPILDDQRVVHHFVLMHDSEGGPTDRSGFECAGIFDQWVYAWGPGMGALQFPAGGLRLNRGQSFIVQIHYNNGGRFEDVRDSSGVRIYYGPHEGPEYGFIGLGPTDLTLPAGARTSETGYCEFREDVEVLSSWPHMHELGFAQESTIIRVNGDEEPLISLRGWQFEAQWIYSTPTTLHAGDSVKTTCTFDNILDHEVNFGPRTEDEMCFNFLYTTPPVGSGFCDGPPPAIAGDQPFEAGDCAPPGVMPEPLQWVEGSLEEGGGPALEGDGSPPLGYWTLDSGQLWLSSFETPAGNIDGEQSEYRARGYAIFGPDGRALIDLQTSIHAALVGGQNLDVPLDASFGGTVLPGDEVTPGSVNLDCGRFAETLSYAVDGDGILTVSTQLDVAGIGIAVVARFIHP